MSLFTLVRRSLLHYWRTQLGVLAGVALSTAVLVGALMTGDAVRGELRAIAAARLGQVRLAMQPPERLFRAALAEELATDLGAPTAPALRLRGTAASAAGEQGRRANRVDVIGVDSRFWALSPSGADQPLAKEQVHLSAALARRLGAGPGDEVLLRVERPNPLPGDMPLSSESKRTVGMRLTVGRVLDRPSFGRFSLKANQLAPFNAFVDLAWLADKVDLEDQANTLLIGAKPGSASEPTVEQAGAALAARFQLADGDLELRAIPELSQLELRSRKVYLEPAAVDAASAAAEDATGVLVYLVNELRIGERSCPYSMVAGVGPLREGTSGVPAFPQIPAGEIWPVQWLADDIGAKPGETLSLAYFEYGPARTLIERKTTLRGGQVLPLAGATGDRNLMPDVPGLSDAETLFEWDSPLPIDNSKLRPKDEAYWKARKGTPKAYVSLATGRELWGSRFGELTAVRFAGKPERAAQLDAALREAIDPSLLGLVIRPVGAQAQTAASNAIDFAGLFGGLSFFLITAALILTAVLFAFGVERRQQQLGLLLAIGLRPHQLRRALLLEGLLVALVGAVIGVGIGIGYTALILGGLASVWAGAVAGAQVPLRIVPLTLMIGPVAGTVVALGAIWLVTRRAAEASPQQLLSGGGQQWQGYRPSGLILAGAALSLIAAIALPLALPADALAGAFFGSGGLLLIACLLAAREWLARLGTGDALAERLSLGRVAVQAMTRRPGRSLAVIALLACGSFLVVAVGANQKGAPPDSRVTRSGTGGFTLYAESTTGVYQQLDSKAGRQRYGLDDAAFDRVSFAQLRVREGDDASCLNLNGPVAPTVLGVRPGGLRGRFRFASSHEGDPWKLLDEAPGEDGAIPCIADQATIMWALKSSVGGILELVDGQGQPMKLKLVAALQGSVLQGALVISEERFLERYPAEQGYRAFLIDTHDQDPAKLALAMRESPPLADTGFEVTTTRERVEAFNQVENTYLTIFAALGGLGLLVGSVGMGLVVLRNVLDRRGELAQLRAIGFSKKQLRNLLIAEHAGLLLIGLLAGAVSAAIAVAPGVAQRAQELPLVGLATTLAIVLASGLVWTILATRAALAGQPLAGLRSE